MICRSAPWSNDCMRFTTVTTRHQPHSIEKGRKGNEKGTYPLQGTLSPLLVVRVQRRVHAPPRLILPESSYPKYSVLDKLFLPLLPFSLDRSKRKRKGNVKRDDCWSKRRRLVDQRGIRMLPVRPRDSRAKRVPIIIPISTNPLLIVEGRKKEGRRKRTNLDQSIDHVSRFSHSLTLHLDQKFLAKIRSMMRQAHIQ